MLMKEDTDGEVSVELFVTLDEVGSERTNAQLVFVVATRSQMPSVNQFT